MNLFGTLGAAAGFLGVAAGAFGAHALKARLGPELLAIFETGARYQLYHALALLWVAQLPASGARTVAGWGFALGILLFSGSLYGLALTGVRLWGAVTPFGGVSFLVGWAALLLANLRTA